MFRLTLVIFALLVASLPVPVESKQLADYPNEFIRDGQLIVFPDHGTVYIATDFHAHWTDFNQWLKQTQFVERIEAGEDVYALIIGDVVDHKPGDPVVEPFGDAKIVDRIRQIQKQLGEKGQRLVYLKGNHELAASDTYAMLKQHGLNDDNRKRLVDLLYRSLQGPYYQQFNFVERMTDEQYEYLIRLPTTAIAKNGIVIIHAGTSRSAESLADLVQPSQKIRDELLWDRPHVAKVDGYTSSQTETFLKRLGGNVLIVGHTPLSYLPRESVKDGVSRLDKHQLFFATGYGAPPGVQSYLAIDLSKAYRSASDLQLGVEIHPLYPMTSKE